MPPAPFMTTQFTPAAPGCVQPRSSDSSVSICIRGGECWSLRRSARLMHSLGCSEGACSAGSVGKAVHSAEQGWMVPTTSRMPLSCVKELREELVAYHSGVKGIEGFWSAQHTKRKQMSIGGCIDRRIGSAPGCDCSPVQRYGGNSRRYLEQHLYTAH